VKYCTKNITFGFSVQLEIGFELRVECTGVLVYAAGSACISATVAGITKRACIEAYLLGGGRADVDVTVGTQAGQCVYGLTLAVGLRATIGSHTIWQGEFGYGKAITAPCVNQLNTKCTDTLLQISPHAIPGATLRPLRV
jgi:hypothetical protein